MASLGSTKPATEGVVVVGAVGVVKVDEGVVGLDPAFGVVGSCGFGDDGGFGPCVCAVGLCVLPVWVTALGAWELSVAACEKSAAAKTEKTAAANQSRICDKLRGRIVRPIQSA